MRSYFSSVLLARPGDFERTLLVPLPVYKPLLPHLALHHTLLDLPFAMIEDFLRNDKQNPTEVAKMLLQFIRVQLPGGGPDAERRFLRMYEMLMLRIYGKLDPSTKLYEGTGWMSASMAWRRSSQRDHRSHQLGQTLASHVTESIDKDPVAQLLGASPKKQATPLKEPTPPQTLVEAIAREAENLPSATFPFEFSALPQHMRDSYLALIEQSYLPPHTQPDGKESPLTRNDADLFARIITQKPHMQQEIQAFYRQKSSNVKLLQNATHPQLSPRGMWHGQQSAVNTPTQDERKSAQEDAPKLMLSVLEHFLFSFLHFPLAAPKATPSSHSSPGLRRHGAYGDRLYLHLFKTYVHFFVPHTESLTVQGELFLRTVYALWIESFCFPRSTRSMSNVLQGRLQRTGQSADFSPDLHQAYDLTVCVKSNLSEQPLLVRKASRLLVEHLLADPALEVAVDRRQGTTPALKEMQQSFYNLVRGSFRYGAIHSSGSSFFAALDLWLLYLEPWNVVTTKLTHFSPTKQRSSSTSRTVKVLSSTQASRYSKKWESYIAANIYIYVVPLAIFLRRARELEFTTKSFAKSAETLQRVFRVFTPDVMLVLEAQLGAGAPYASLVEAHRASLDAHAPPTSFQNLSSLHEDMQTLLEEAHMPHFKRLQKQNFLERFFGSATRTQAEERKLHAIVERAKVMVRLPADYQVESAFAKPLRGQARSGARSPLRDKNGILTEEGRKQFFESGRVDVLDAPVGVDPMELACTMYEIAALVRLTVEVSRYINKAYNFTGDGSKGSFRVNLRFLADRRTLLWLVLAIKVLPWYMPWLGAAGTASYFLLVGR